MNSIIPYGKQDITEDDIKIVTETLKADFLTQGPRIKQFEESFADYVGARYAVAVSNGTAALHLCAMSLNLSSGDKVITTPITFAASANCIKYCGGEVVLVDIDPETYLIDLDKVEKILKESKAGEYKGIIPVDFAGRPVDLERLRKITEKYGLWIIEDSCHSPGGYFTDEAGSSQKCGNGNYADLSIFSFHPVKHIAAGEGGMVTTNDKNLYERLLVLRTHGITRNEALYQNSKEVAYSESISGNDWPGWYMEMQELGYNYRLTDIQAALGYSQLGRASVGLERRKSIAKKYNEAFNENDKIKNHSGFVKGHAYHLYIIEVENRAQLYNFLRTHNIFTQIHYIPLHYMPYYKDNCEINGDLLNAELYYSRCLSLPMYPTLTNEEQEYVISKIEEFINV